MPSKNKYRNISDLYVRGREVVLRDGNVMWLQVLNPFEMEQARHDAQVARARVILALRQEDSDEMIKAKAYFFEDGIAEARERLLGVEMSQTLVEITDALKDDPEWTEKIDLLERSEHLGVEASSAEKEALERATEEYGTELSKRFTDETEFRRSEITKLSEEDLWERYREVYEEMRSGELAMREFILTQMWLAARACDGIQNEDGSWSHSMCQGHRTRVFETKSDIKDLPEDLYGELAEAMAVLTLSEREAKNLDRQGSSSESSPLPSEEAAQSTPSTQTGTSNKPRGTSTRQSATA